MTRRRLVALVSVAVLFTLGLLVVGAVFFITGTNAGRERLRGVLQPWVASKIHGGSIYIGHLGGNFLTYVTVDSLAIRDKRGELFASTGRDDVHVRSARPDRQPHLHSARVSSSIRTCISFSTRTASGTSRRFSRRANTALRQNRRIQRLAAGATTSSSTR